MSRSSLVAGRVTVAAAVVAAALAGASAASAAVPVSAVCGPVPAHHARCLSLLVKGSARPLDVLAPSGYGAPDLQSAYQLPSATAGAG